MKIIKILGIVAGLHAFALLLIFANPGCSSAGASGAGDDTAAKPAPAPAPAGPAASVSVPPVVTASAVGDPGPAAAPAPITSSPEPSGAEPQGGPAIRYSPTRPGTAVAAALEAQPVEDVTPASTYTVGKGDSLWTVAKKNHLKIADLCSANKLKPSAPLHVGQKLILPSKSGASSGPPAAAMGAGMGAGKTASAMQQPSRAPAAAPADLAGSRVSGGSGDSERHVVKPGETLGAIARYYHVKVGDIATANSISDPKRIHPGQELIIPGKRAAAPAALDSKTPEAKTLIVGPAPDQDLDSGVKPAAAGEVPVIKIDNGSQAPPSSP